MSVLVEGTFPLQRQRKGQNKDRCVEEPGGKMCGL